MTKNEIVSTILSIPGATMARANKANFVVIPTDEGVIKVNVGTALSIDTKNHKAFNLEAAVAEYKAWEAESALRAAEKAARPKKVSGPNPEAEARRQELDAKITALPAFTDYTATDIHAALAGQIADNVTRMAVGQSARRLVAQGILTVASKENDNKPYYTKA